MNDEHTTDPKYLALMAHFNVSEDHITDEGHNRYTVDTEPGEYWVLDESEADEAWEESLDSYLDDCVMPELPAMLQQYFDFDAWKRDARFDGRGHCLSSYDGEEHEEEIDGHWYYIYRTN